MIHRDIKPDNLMQRKVDSQIFLIDFGAVKQVAATQVNHLKQNTTVGIGTEGYTPIEQTLGKPHLGGSDIYALGIVVLQALTGTSDATNLMDANTAQIQWRHLAKVSSEFGAVLDKMVANAVVNRYQSAMEVIEVLKAISLQSRGNPVKASIGINQPNFTAFIKSKLTIVTKKPKNLQNWLMGIVVGGGLIAVGWFVRPSTPVKVTLVL